MKPLDKYPRNVSRKPKPHQTAPTAPFRPPLIACSMDIFSASPTRWYSASEEQICCRWRTWFELREIDLGRGWSHLSPRCYDLRTSLKDLLFRLSLAWISVLFSPLPTNSWTKFPRRPMSHNHPHFGFNFFKYFWKDTTWHSGFLGRRSLSGQHKFWSTFVAEKRMLFLACCFSLNL